VQLIGTAAQPARNLRMKLHRDQKAVLDAFESEVPSGATL
jgi:hypothetical protein